ncbi:MAG: hypothetical protein MZV49_16105 [Rhodopseudomonas palustris]|nr:hypothetical protein [Rhodopseudomonas palustris]
MGRRSLSARISTAQAAYFGLESPDSRAVLQQERQRHAVRRCAAPAVGIYLRALWGRDFLLRPTISDHEEFPLLHRGRLGCICRTPPMCTAPCRGLDVYRAMAAHVAAHLVYTSRPPSIDEADAGQTAS